MNAAPCAVDKPELRHALAGELTIRTAGTLKGSLAVLLAGDGPVVLQAHAVQRIDTAALQVLCAFAQALRAAGRELRWQSPPRVLTDASTLLGLSTALGLGGA